MSVFSNENSIELGSAVAKPARKVRIDATEANPVVAVPTQRAAQATDVIDAVARQHAFYVAARGTARRYFSDYQQKTEVMRSDPKRITTRLSDKQTVAAMLDLAQTRAWNTIRVRGSEDFRREAWVQAQVRGITAEGYKPTQTDTQEATRRKAAMAAVAEAQPAKAPAPKLTQAARSKAVWGAVEEAGRKARETTVAVPTAKMTSTA